MGIESRVTNLEAIKGAIHRWNIKHGKGAKYLEVREKIMHDCGVKCDTADEYLHTLIQTKQVRDGLGGLWAVNL